MKVQTLKKNYEFNRVLTKGKYFCGKYLIMIALKNNYNFNRIGIAIGKKIGNSVKRNKIKRLVRENYRKLEIKINGFDIVFLWNKKTDTKDINYEKIKIDIEDLFLKAKDL